MKLTFACHGHILAIRREVLFDVHVETINPVCFSCYCAGIRDRFGGKEFAGNFTDFQPALCYKPGVTLYTRGNDFCHKYAVCIGAISIAS